MSNNDLIRRTDAIAHPFANGKYDHDNANKDFIKGYESYKEWLEELPCRRTADERGGADLRRIESQELARYAASARYSKSNFGGLCK